MVSLVIGIVFMLAGVILYKHPPRKINWVYGYRTRRSMKDAKTWAKAQRVSSIEMIRMGTLLMGYAIVTYIIGLSVAVEAISSAVLMTGLTVLLFIRTERAIKIP